VEETFGEALAFALRHRFFLAAFNHLVPFPGTPLYERLAREGRLASGAWWLDPAFRFGDAPFEPRHFTAERLRERCLELRTRYRRIGSPPRWRARARYAGAAARNWQMRREVRQRPGFARRLPLRRCLWRTWADTVSQAGWSVEASVTSPMTAAQRADRKSSSGVIDIFRRGRRRLDASNTASSSM
jgi:hypothetical protein